jgi:GAF domain
MDKTTWRNEMDGSREYPLGAKLSLRPLIDHLKALAHSKTGPMACRPEEIEALIREAPELMDPIEDPAQLDRHKEVVSRLMGYVFPPLFWENGIVGAIVPFSMKPFFVSPKFQSLFLGRDGILGGRTNVDHEMFKRGRTIRAFLFILEKFYGIRQRLDYPIIRIVPDLETGLDRHFKMNFDFRYVDVHAVREPKSLTETDRRTILDHLTEPEVLARIIPPEDFELHGFTLLQAVDVTQSEVLSALERDLVDQETMTSEEGFSRLQTRLRTFLGNPRVMVGLAATQEEGVLILNRGCNCIFLDSHHVSLSDYQGSVFQKAICGENIVCTSDLRAEPSSSPVDQEILASGLRSLLVAPLKYQGKPIGVLQLGSPEEGDLGPMDALMAEQVLPLFSMALKRGLDQLENQIQAVIKEKCTALHPSVEWRFRKAALDHLRRLRSGETSEMEPIVFKEAYPIYGVSDIRGSSVERNRAIQTDFMEQLQFALKIIDAADESRSMAILQELANNIKGQLESVQNGPDAGEELAVAKFIRNEVEPIFPHLEGFGPHVKKAIETYNGLVDNRVGMVYRFRKDYENSVTLLNDRLAGYLDKEEAEVQKVFPHYYERHRTDGVDYLIYMGHALSERGQFSELYLKNIRLWQLKVACGMAWHTESLKPVLPISLDTAHLIFVQFAPLSIRFRYDEKRFDVDGAYDVRHQLVKSRLDKAMIKGVDERLTQPGKVAIVYSQAEEEAEMMRHISFLQTEGYLTNDLEKLEVEELPGVQGLKALRVGVDFDSPVRLQVVGGPQG